MAKGRFYSNVRKYFFTQRVIGLWNSLPGYVVEAETLGVFKNRLDKVLDAVQT